MHHITDRIAHTTAFVTPLVEHWSERKIAQLHHEQRFLPCCYISLPSVIKILVFSDTTKLPQIQQVLPYINNNNYIILYTLWHDLGKQFKSLAVIFLLVDMGFKWMFLAPHCTSVSIHYMAYSLNNIMAIPSYKDKGNGGDVLLWIPFHSAYQSLYSCVQGTCHIQQMSQHHTAVEFVLGPSVYPETENRQSSIQCTCTESDLGLCQTNLKI